MTLSNEEEGAKDEYALIEGITALLVVGPLFIVAIVIGMMFSNGLFLREKIRQIRRGEQGETRADDPLVGCLVMDTVVPAFFVFLAGVTVAYVGVSLWKKVRELQRL